MKPKRVESKKDRTPGIVIAETASTFIVTWYPFNAASFTSSVSKKSVRFIQE